MRLGKKKKKNPSNFQVQIVVQSIAVNFKERVPGCIAVNFLR
jgi:hypothetical protein